MQLRKGARVDSKLGSSARPGLQQQASSHQDDASQLLPPLPLSSGLVPMLLHAARMAAFNAFLALTLVLFFAPWFRQVTLTLWPFVHRMFCCCHARTSG